MRVLAYDLDNYVSGAQRSFLTLLRALRAKKTGVTALVGEGPIAAEFEEAGIEVWSTSATLRSVRVGPTRIARTVADIYSLASSLRSAARRAQADVIHANSARAGVVAIAATFFGGPPVVVHIRNSSRASVSAVLARALILWRAAAVLAVSEYTGSSFDLPVLRRTIPIRNAIDPSSFARSRASGDCRKEFGDDRPGRFVLGIVAQIMPVKAQDDAIRILAFAREAGVDAALWIIGEPKRPAHMDSRDIDAYALGLQALASNLHVTDSVRFLGHRSDVPDLLADMSLLLIPSHEEAFSRMLIEAMTVGTPVVASAASGMGEVVVHGENGFLVAPGQPRVWADLVARLAREDATRATIVAHARRTACAEFDAGVQADRVMAIYASALTRHGRRRGRSSKPSDG